MPKRYHGGLWLNLNKKPAADRPIDELSAPARVVVPLLQHKGEPAQLCVKKGDHVLLGQPVGTGGRDVSCSVHSPVSGIVVDITEISHPLAGTSTAVVLQNDGEDTPYESIPQRRDAAKMTPEDIVARIRTVAVTAVSSGFPLWWKIGEIARKGVKTLVINAVESEPYLCNAQKLMEEDPEEVASGFLAIMKAAGCKRGVLAVGDDTGSECDDVIKAASLLGFGIKLLRMPPKYPSGYEKFLCRAVTGERLPEGALPEDVGVSFVYAEDCYNVYRGFRQGMPQITRIVTVAGSAVANPQVFEIRIGTSIHEVLERCGLSFEPERVVLGSSMSGVAVDDLNIPITKNTGALLALRAAGRRQPSRCISCGKCVRVCPQRLFPNFIALNAVNADWKACSALHIESCIECGSCSYICPGRMPIVELIKNLKKAQLAEKRGA